GVKMDKMLNRFHMWFPGGILLGSLISQAMTSLNLGWELQMWVTMVPTVIYAFLFFGKTFPKPLVAEAMSLGQNVRAMFTPTFLFVFFCMFLTAISEFGPNQWVSVIMAASGAEPMLILAVTSGLMAVGRFFGGPVVQLFGQNGVLLGGAIHTTIGIYMFSTVTGPMAYVATVIFALGICWFWPTMIGVAAQRVPKSGALGMSIIGAAGMLSSAIFQPVIGSWIDGARATNSAAGLTGNALELATGQDAMVKMLTFPSLLIVLFLIFFFWQKNKQKAAESATATA